jgi:DNA replication protein DnaC
VAETHRLLDSYLKTLRLPTFAKNWSQVAQDAMQSNLSYDRFLLALAEQEIHQREANRQQQRIRAARFPLFKELADFDFSCIQSPSKERVIALTQGQYIQTAEPVLIIGNPGLGKTHIALSLALAAARQGHPVRFYNTAALVNEMIQAQQEHQLARWMDKALKYRLIVLDELGFIPFTDIGAQLIFQFCSALYERVSVILTTNLPFADWTQVFGDERLTAALLDRLTHKAHILEFIGESYRFKERMKRQKKTTP